MKGDFSKWGLNASDPYSNYTGVLHQQGRVLLDQDWNANTEITRLHRQTLAQDAIGVNVAAVPYAHKDSFKLMSATATPDGVEVTLNAGRVWVNGLMVNVAGTASDPYAPYAQAAYYFDLPIEDLEDISSIAAGTRDAVVLEVWEESLNAFQVPQEILEPALGGVDTTERIQLYHRLRLLRLADGEHCHDLVETLTDDFDAKGTLTVAPAPTLAIAGQCPVALSGGYTGFEHYLYRVEIAQPDVDDNARFKWSRFNGGLVGRGLYQAADDEIIIQQNDQAIRQAGLDTFFVEVLEFDEDEQRWLTKLTADATLADDRLSLTNVLQTGSIVNNNVFFRLWDGAALISDFPTGLAQANELLDGLLLAFDAPEADNANYTPGDYWTFDVRAQGVDAYDTSRWPDASPPEGVKYHRVPLGILNWRAAPTVTINSPANIDDCRHVFHPLANLDSCCTVTVGDGRHSQGDFESIQEAIHALPPRGGKVCILAGVYEENVDVNRSNVMIHGCGPQTRVVGVEAAPVFTIAGQHSVSIDNLSITAHDEAQGILIESRVETEPSNDDVNIPTVELESMHIDLMNLVVVAATRSAVEATSGQHIRISKSHILMQDVASEWHGVFMMADDVIIEDNYIGVMPSLDASGRQTVHAGRGGLHIAGTCERVDILRNQIEGGISNGITLGSLEAIDENGVIIFGVIGWIVNANDPCDPCAPGTVYWPPFGTNPDDDDGIQYRSAGSLYDIRIEDNHILRFGLNGIGVVAFFDLEDDDEMISVNGLEIRHNHIEKNVTRDLAPVPDNMRTSMGFGGIALADVTDLTIRENRIENNGRDHLAPVCGVFILNGEGVEINDNYIINNGAKTTEPARQANLGARAGIHVTYTTAPKIATRIRERRVPRQNGVPALSVKHNVVVQPLGRALSATALGPVTVESNEFTSQGMVFQTGAPSFFASTVFILNLGMSNELYLQQLLFRGKGLDDVQSPTVRANDNSNNLAVSRQGMGDQAFFSYLGNGNILFNDNQVMLDLLDTTGFNLSVSSIALVSLDDISFSDNQCDAAFDFGLDDFMLAQAVVLGLTVRVNSNRFKESVIGSLYSALTMSLFANTTTLNQATHCIRAMNFLGAANLFDQPNTILFDIFNLCRERDQAAGILQQSGDSTLATHSPTNPNANTGTATANTGSNNVLSLLN